MTTAPNKVSPPLAERLEQVYERYVATFGAKRIDDIVLLHAVDGTFWLHSGREPVRGRKAIGATFQGFFDQWPEFGFDIHRTLFTASGWVLDWSVTAVLGGATQTPGRPVSFHALDVVDVNHDGFVARKDTYIDLAEVRAALEL